MTIIGKALFIIMRVDYLGEFAIIDVCVIVIVAAAVGIINRFWSSFRSVVVEFAGSCEKVEDWVIASGLAVYLVVRISVEAFDGVIVAVAFTADGDSVGRRDDFAPASSFAWWNSFPERVVCSSAKNARRTRS